MDQVGVARLDVAVLVRVDHFEPVRADFGIGGVAAKVILEALFGDGPEVVVAFNHDC